MVPTHRHADGGLYRLAASDIEGKKSGDWVEGVLYQDVVSSKMFWTSNKRFEERFTPIPKSDQRHVRLNLFEDDSVIATFSFVVTEADDIRHLLIRGHAHPNMDDQLFRQVRRVLEAQAEIMTQGLHRDQAPTVDFLGDVIAFHRKFDQQPRGPHVLAKDLFEFRQKFHLEEAGEYRDSGHELYTFLETSVADDGNRFTPEERETITKYVADQLDAICDTLFVVFGTVDLQFDRPTLTEAWRRVVDKNMQKVRAYGEGDDRSKRDTKFDIVKPEGWTPPDHADLIKF